MEVPGKTRDRAQGFASSSGSFECNGVLCQPCSSEGEILVADGFCKNCQEYLCKTCIKYHRKVTVSKHHTILDKANIPKNVDHQTIKQLCTETCEKHKLEIIKYFCRDHDTVGCGNCMVIKHKACQVEFIPDIADEFINGEYKAILDRIEKLQTKVDSKIMSTEKGKKACAEEFVFAVNEIKRFRKEIENYLNKMEKSVLKECERLRKENENVITKNEGILKTIKSELDGITEYLKSLSKKTTDLFVEAKQTEARLSQLEQALTQTINTTYTEYTFVRSSDFDAMVSGSCSLVTDKKLTPIREIKVNGQCRGIAHYQNTLLVSFVEPPKLQILTLDGEVVHNITAGTLGWPGCVEVNVCGSSFFVSDNNNSSLMKFSFDGKLLATYQDESFKYPRSFTVCEDDRRNSDWLTIRDELRIYIYLGSWESQLMEITDKLPLEYFRYVDDVWGLWTHGIESLKSFHELRNNLHPRIKLELRYSTEKLEFLDVMTKIQNGILITDLYTKPTDKHLYLHKESSHPESTKRSRPYGLVLRAKRICTNESTYKQHRDNIKTQLQKRGYEDRHIETELKKVDSKKRSDLLQYNEDKENTERIPVVLTFSRALPNVGQIVRKHLPE
ncbi:uncharacterized protein LOC132744627 [Ruditapes philippinarum]|uniref:uncharacterized protein LOC132744627 n=1 Tax=Ruditapes philippinarum TaxID=129788 RepID=UPI00295AB6E5|nr:uncharacterized protein LOC132744627 [Ruditapes philippinarum]